MPTLVVYSTSPQAQALATLRYGAPASASGWEIVVGKEGIDAVFPERVRQADAVLIQRDFPRFFEAYRQVISEARTARKPVLYDIDDLLLAIPSEHPNRRDYEDALGGMAFALLQADRVIVSTPLLRDVLLPIQPQTVVWPTVLPDSLWRLRLPGPAALDEPLTLGYMGGTPYTSDLALLVLVLQRVLETYGEDVRIHFWGCPPPAELAGFPQVRQVHAREPDYAAFAETFAATASADIWLAPLLPGLFNRCKSSIKFWEYSAVGGVGIYSRLEPYEMVVRDGENGLLASTPEEWYAAITRLAEGADLRLRLAQNAQQTLRSQGLLSHHLEAWREIYSTTPVRTAGAQNVSLLAQMLVQFGERVQLRSDERRDEASRDQVEVIRLLDRSIQLEEILQSRFWRALHRLHRLRRQYFSPTN